MVPFGRAELAYVLHRWTVGGERRTLVVQVIVAYIKSAVCMATAASKRSTDAPLKAPDTNRGPRSHLVT